MTFWQTYLTYWKARVWEPVPYTCNSNGDMITWGEREKKKKKRFKYFDEVFEQKHQHLAGATREALKSNGSARARAFQHRVALTSTHRREVRLELRNPSRYCGRLMEAAGVTGGNARRAYRQRLSLQRLQDEVAHDAPIVHVHPGAEGVEDPRHPHLHSFLWGRRDIFYFITDLTYFAASAKEGTGHGARLCRVHGNVFEDSLHFFRNVTISELLLLDSRTDKQLTARSHMWSSVSRTYAAHMPRIILDTCKCWRFRSPA